MQAESASPRPATLTTALLLTMGILLLIMATVLTMSILTMAAGGAGGVGLPDGTAAAAAG